MTIHQPVDTPSIQLQEEFQGHIKENEALNEEYYRFIENYASIFSAYENYLYYGNIQRSQGWLIHLSVVKTQIIPLLTKLIPNLTDQNIPFKVPANMDIAHSILDGNLGYILLGKVVTIYPEDESSAVDLVGELIPMTDQFIGPPIPTDRQIHNIIYTRYGSFNPVPENIDGVMGKYISNENGALVPDTCTVPFNYPAYLNWPFSEFTVPYAPPEHKLLNYTYYPLNILKSDAKGKVLKALYFRKFYHIKSCLIKEGRHNMFSDMNDRDIRDRLKWQFKLQTELYPQVPVPKAIAYFQQRDNDYFVMEFIKGDSLAIWLEKKTKNQLFKGLPINSQIILLKKLVELIGVIDNLHRLRYVHRDINPYNIVLQKNDRIRLIDMELTWSLNNQFPYPPFQLGTPGFMSPEQQKVLRPTVKEDVYAVGALMIYFFVNLSPTKLAYKINNTLLENLTFFVGDHVMASMIFSCLQTYPDQRPTLLQIIETLGKHIDLLQSAKKSTGNILKSNPRTYLPLQPMIASAIRGLSHSQLIDSEKRWLSRAKADEGYIVNNSGELKPLAGWHTGGAGPLWLLARAAHLGYDISSCVDVYKANWAFLHHITQQNPEMLGPGLYYGGSGIALALSEAMRYNLLPATQDNMVTLSSCFSQPALMGGLSHGSAGRGLALLACARWLPPEVLSSQLRATTQSLLNNQLPDGSWPVAGLKGDYIRSVGFSHGITGIVWFLLAALDFTKEDSLKTPIYKALRWLRKKAKYGTHNLALTFIKAHQIFEENEFKQLWEKWMTNHPQEEIIDDLTLKGGLAALGETYLEAALTFKSQQWQERADWIAQALAHTMQKTSEGKGLWIIDRDGKTTADLFNGSAGIIHFLLRMSAPEKLGHPLWFTASQ